MTWLCIGRPYQRLLEGLPERSADRLFGEAGLDDELEDVLTDLGFIEAKCTAGIGPLLPHDYELKVQTQATQETRILIDESGRFILSRLHVIAEEPSLTFQEAANQPDSTDPAQAAQKLWDGSVEHRPWLKWLNRPHETNPVPDDAQRSR